MSVYVARRLAQSLIVLLGISVVVFVILHLTGDPTLLMLPPDVSAEEVARFRKAMGFDDPLPVQYWRFLRGVLQGNFGNSLRHDEPALGLVFERMPATLELTARGPRRRAAPRDPGRDRLRSSSATPRSTTSARWWPSIGQAMPTFWLGIMLILVFAVGFQVLPSSGRGGLTHLILPALTLGLFTAARTMRLTRSALLEVLGQDYVRTARAKGVAERGVVWKHALRNASIPIITIVGLELGTLLGGAVITETIFAWPGVGRLSVQAIYNRDYPLVQASVFVLASIFVLVNLAVDLVYTYLDPRIRLG